MLKGDTSQAEVFDEPYPCEGCVHWDTCAEKQLSCKSFYLYVTYKGHLDLTQRQPSTFMYHKTFIRRGKREMAYERLVLLEELLCSVESTT